MTHQYSEIDLSNLPRHIAIIMDGNGRWAKARSWDRIRGHREGVKSVRAIVRLCRKIGVEVLTLYSFSTENWDRPKKEVNALMQLLHRFLKSERKEMKERGIRLNTLGDLTRFPANVQTELQRVMDDTAENKGLTLNLALNYGGRAEIIRAMRLIGERIASGELAPGDIDEGLVSECLYTGSLPDPDLLIRTGGESRISNFLLWQIAYTEIYLTSIPWPEFRENELIQAIKDYQAKERRFGLTSDQVTKIAG